MNSRPPIPIAPDRQRKRAQPKGRQVDATALADVQAALGALPLRRDLLIEHLHALQDGFGQLRTDHVAALAQLLKLAQAEVFEVASFYHHFDVVREDAAGSYPAPPN
jgi:formate dehydrogenase beta subunit